MSASIDRVAVVGAGRMGHGIALVYALAGHDVVVFDVDETVLASAPRRVDDALDTMVRAGDVDRECADAALSNLRTEFDLAAAVAERTRASLDAAGKTPVVLEREIPGFVGNRIQAAMTYEAYSLLARGVASAADIDRGVATRERDEALLALRSLYEDVDAESSPPVSYDPADE